MSRTDSIFMAKVSNEVERYPDMIAYIRKAISSDNNPLTPEERSLLAIAYKNQIAQQRTSWRSLAAIQATDEVQTDARKKLLNEHRKLIETELTGVIKDILDLLGETLASNASGNEEKIFYLKLTGDYNRYLAEYSTGETLTKS